MALKVRKRDGSVENFSFRKLLHSVAYAFRHAKVRDHESASATAHEVREILRHKRKKTVSTNEIELMVAKVLKRRKLSKVLKFYKLEFLQTRKPKIVSVIKRGGSREKFDAEKVFKSVCKAFRLAHEPIDHRCHTITLETVKALEKKKKKTIASDDIKETIEKILERKKLPSVARAYVMHRYL